MTVLNMDCIEGMRLFPDGYFDSIVTDPPYELGFMGKSWDASGIAYSVEMWREALRVLKPGGHLLAFSGSRTYHRMVCAIEDAGFEIRDQIMWVYGSGMPKAKTQLRGCHEPIAVCRKKFAGSERARMEADGVGGLNIEACRTESGGWPGNFIHDGLSERWAPYFYHSKASGSDRDEGLEAFETKVAGGLAGRADGSLGSITMRKNTHPTVKPTDLMRYLCRLVTPTGGTVLDPFTGSGSTGKAARLEGFGFIGFELSEEYTRIATARIAGVSAP